MALTEQEIVEINSLLIATGATAARKIFLEAETQRLHAEIKVVSDELDGIRYGAEPEYQMQQILRTASLRIAQTSNPPCVDDTPAETAVGHE